MNDIHGGRRRLIRGLLMGAVGATFTAAGTAAQTSDDEIDWERARALHQRVLRGETLTASEQAYHDRAARALANRTRENRGGGGGDALANRGGARGGRDFIGLVPITELGSGTYKGETGGLYGDGRNVLPASHAAAAGKAAQRVRLLDAAGRPSASGKIVLLSIGMSNTTMEFSAFRRRAETDSARGANVVIVDGAQGGKAAEQWLGRQSAGVWKTADDRLRAASATPEQVQAVWLKQALIDPRQYGEYPAHTDRLGDDLVAILCDARKRYPNLQLAYLSSRIYAGYATSPLNPEPYAYESAFAVRRTILAQIKGDPKLNFDSARGPINAPVLLWGPYLWADGLHSRKDGLLWTREDLSASDGTHPSAQGQQKVADLLLRFFKTDPSSRSWFLRSSGHGPGGTS